MMWNLTSWLSSALSAWNQVEGVLSAEPEGSEGNRTHFDGLYWTQFASEPYHFLELIGTGVDQALKFQSEIFSLATNVTLSIAKEVLTAFSF